MTRIQNTTSARQRTEELQQKLYVLEGLVQCAIYFLNEHEGDANLSVGLLYGFRDFKDCLDSHVCFMDCRDNLQLHL